MKLNRTIIVPTCSQISGKRFWGLFKDLCGKPENFFRTSFVYNYLPEQWMKSNGCNVTPSDFKVCLDICYLLKYFKDNYDMTVTNYLSTY